MTPLLAGRVTRLLSRPSPAHLLVTEVPAAQGIADLVAVRFNPEAVRLRLDHGIGPICSPLRVRALDLLREDRGVRARSLARKLGTNERALMRSTLRPLAELGAIDLGRGMVRSTGAWRPAATQLTAIELKLSNWRTALRQADNFALSADWSWVVLDQARAGPAEAAVDRFREFGVGLAVLGSEGLLYIVTRPRRRPPERWLRALMAERAWATAEAEVAAIAG
jgi:hypothetical protein